MDKNTGHISWPDLLATVDQACETGGQERIFKHLAKCQECLQKWEEIRKMRVIFSAGKQPESPPSKNCLDEEKIATYLDQRLSEAEVQALQRHIRNCNFCFYRLAHSYKCQQQIESQESEPVTTPPWLLKEALSLGQPTSRPRRPDSARTRRIGFNLQRPFAWIRERLLSPLPGYALAGVSLLLLLLLRPGLSREAGQLVSFPETTGLWVFAEVPVAYRNGTGGVATALDESKALYQEPLFSGMRVEEKKGRGLVFCWPTMKDTQEYNFTLLSKDRKGDRILLSVTTPKERYDYSYKKYGTLETGRLYEWVVSGNYGDGLHFKAKANFTIIK
jgi:hypothetical protein